MAVETTNAFSGPFIPNGVTTVFPFDFTAPSDQEVAVMLRTASGTESFPTDFAVTINPAGGGSITFLNPPAAGPELYILLDPDFRQQIGFENGSGWLAEPVNEIADRSAARDQVLKREIGRSILAPLGEGAMTMPPAADRAGKFLSFLADGGILMSGGTGADSGLREDLASSGAAMTGNQLPVGEDLRTQPVSDFINNNVLQPSQFAGTAEQKLTRAITEANASRDGGQGQTVQLPRGEIETTSPFNIENRVTLMGVNKRGSRLKASSEFVGSFMATVDNGGISSFDNALERLTLDCNGVAGLSGVDSYAWQEGGGLRNVLIEGFQVYGVKFTEGNGGAANCVIQDTEIFGGVVTPAVAGVRVEQISAIGSFVLRVSDTTIAGRDGVQMPRGIDIVNDSSVMFAVHFEEVASGIYLDGVGDHMIIGATGHNTTETLIEIAPTFTGSVTLIGCQRAGATNFLKDNRAGGYGTISGRDIPYVRIETEPPLFPGAIVASASIDGTGAPSVTKGFGIAGIIDNGTGDYTITLSRSAQAASDFTVFASTNQGVGNVRCDLNGVNSVRIRCFDAAGVATDVNELKVLVVRVA